MLDERLINNDGETDVLVFDGNPILSKALDVCQNKKTNLHFFKEDALSTEAVEFLESNEVDLVIIDISVDVKNRLSMTEHIKTEYPMRPIIMLTIEDEKNSSGMSKSAEENNPVVQKVSAEILQVLDYADSLLRCQICGFIISLDI